MATKQTQLRHSARKRIMQFLQPPPYRFWRAVERGNADPHIAYSIDGPNEVLAFSGWLGIAYARKHYGIEFRDLLPRFNAMAERHGYSQAIKDRAAHECAEAHLWMTLVGLSANGRTGSAPRHFARHPRHLSIWVFELTRKWGIKEDSPCQNCRQWVRTEFRLVNGTGT